jgi:hypothetical protein
MPRLLSLTLSLVLAVPLARAAPPALPTRVSPVYSLPAPGTWVEYEWKAVGPNDKERAGLFRISSVGRLQVRGVPHCWIEIARESREGGKTVRRVRKVLVKSEAFAKDRSLQGHVVAGYHRGGAGRPAVRLSPRRLQDFLGMGIGAPEATVKEVRAAQKVDTRLGTFHTRHVVARGRRAGRTLEYHGWLTGEVPFGWAKFEIHEKGDRAPSRIVCVAVAVRKGQGAVSEVDESTAK